MRSQLCRRKKRWVMFRKVLILTVIVLAFAASDLQAGQISCTWIGGEEGLWGDPCNWNPAVVPDNDTNAFNVTIDGSSIDVEVGLQQHRTINRLDCYGYVELVTWTSEWVVLTLTDPNGLVNYSELEIEPDITGNVTNKSGAYLLMDDTDIDDGNLYNEAGAKLETETLVGITNGNFTNDGSVFVRDYSELHVSGGSFTNNGTIQIKDGWIGNEDDGINEDLVNTSSGSIWGSGNVVSAGVNIVNGGNITASSGKLVLLAEEIINTGTLESKPGSALFLEVAVSDVNNQGNIIVNPGSTVSVKLEKLFTEPNDCALNNVPNGTIQLLGGVLSVATITQAADANFTGFGTISGNVIIETDGLISLTGPTNIIGNVTVSAGATLQISDGQTLITGQTVNNGTIELIGGTVIFQGGYTGGGTIPVTAGTDRNHFDVNSDGIENFKDFASFAESWLWQASWY